MPHRLRSPQRGSKATVLKYRDQVIEEIRNQLQGHALSAGMPQALQAPLAAFWQAAQEVAFERLAEERAAIQQQVEAERLREEVAEGAQTLAEVCDREQVALEQRDQARQREQEARTVEETQRRELETLRAERRPQN